MEFLTGILGSVGGTSAIVALLGVIINWVLKNYVTEDQIQALGDLVERWATTLFRVVTLNLARLPVIGAVWNNTLESVFITVIDTVLVRFLKGLKAGLLSDNDSYKDGKGEAV